MSARYERPLPELTPETAPFWTGGAGGELLIERCGACGRYNHPPTGVCRRCLSAAVSPVAVSGAGTVFSFTVNRRAWVPGQPLDEVIAIVELAEQQGLRLTTNIVDCEPADVVIGMPVAVAFRQHGDVYLPLFRPAWA